MGFLDKAKKLAEQAQDKLDEAQKQFNERQGSSAPSGPAVEYDKHGRPVTPPETVTPPHGDPLTAHEPHAAAPEHPTPDPSAPPVTETPGVPRTEEDEPKRPPSPPSPGSGMTSGDPLAG